MGRIVLQGFRVKGQDGEKAGNVLLGKRLPSPKPVRDVRRIKSADAGPIENRGSDRSTSIRASLESSNDNTKPFFFYLVVQNTTDSVSGNDTAYSRLCWTPILVHDGQRFFLMVDRDSPHDGQEFSSWWTPILSMMDTSFSPGHSSLPETGVKSQRPQVSTIQINELRADVSRGWIAELGGQGNAIRYGCACMTAGRDHLSGHRTDKCNE